MTQIILGDEGSGPAVLLLHAFPLHARMWQPQITALRNSAKFLAADFPGFGTASRAPLLDDIDAIARAVVTGVRELGINAALVVGNSMGGYVAFGIMRTAPDFVKGLALIDTRATADSEEGRGKRLAMIERVEREGCAFLTTEWPPTAISQVTASDRPGVVQKITDLVGQATPAGVVAAQRAMAGRPDSTPLLAAIKVPTVVVHGLDDRIIGVDEARGMAGMIPQAKFVGIPDAGHLPSMERPELVNDALRELIEKV